MLESCFLNKHEKFSPEKKTYAGKKKESWRELKAKKDYMYFSYAVVSNVRLTHPKLL